MSDGDETMGLRALCDMIDADALSVSRWSILFFNDEGEPCCYDAKANAELEGTDELEDLRHALDTWPRQWRPITGGLVSIHRQDGKVNVYAAGDAAG
jgi:hypothetical protein